MNFISAELSNRFTEDDLFAQVADVAGENYREVARRRTVKFEHDGQNYFAKIHFGVGWGEIFKNLFQGRLPVLGAVNEWHALRRLREIGVNSMDAVLYCEAGWNPATIRSCIVTKSLENTISLEDLLKEGKPDSREKRTLIARIAGMARKMHADGINHRDFYLCHFLLERSTRRLYLIDLHRAQMRSSTPERWRAKDLGGLLFSAFEAGLTKRDLLRFIRLYSGDEMSLRDSLQRDAAFWSAVKRRAISLYLQDHAALPPASAQLLEVL